MALYTFTAGIEFNHLGARMPPAFVNAQVKRVRELLVDWAGGFTETATHGGWRGIDGTVYIEKGRRWEVSADKSVQDAEGMARIICAALTQASVMLTHGMNVATFVEG